MKKTVRLTETELIELVKKVINEQEEDDDRPPIPKWNYEKKYKDIFNYLDTNLNGLVKRKPEQYEGIIFVYPEKEYGILEYVNYGTLYIFSGLIDAISFTFGFNESDSKSIIGKWFSNRYQLEVRNTLKIEKIALERLAIDNKKDINEQEEEDDKPPIPRYKEGYTLKDKIFKYLDTNLNGLEKRKAKYFEGIIFAYPKEKYGILGYEKDGTLYIYYELIDEISSSFGLNDSDSKSIIGRWVSDRCQLEVINTYVIENNIYIG